MRFCFRFSLSKARGAAWRTLNGALLAALLFVAAPIGLAAAADDRAADTPAAPAPSAAELRLKADVTYLAADAREGRAPGTKGIEASADYIASTFSRLGLKTAPGADGYFQKFKISGRSQLGKPLELAVAGPGAKTLQAEPKTEFSPLAMGSSGKVAKIPIVFAGYGITAKNPATELDYDDYAGVDVEGKAVLIIRREPRQDRDDSPFDGKRTSDYATFRHKATNAFQHGAAIVLLVNDLAGIGSDGDKLLSLIQAGQEAMTKLPVVMLTRAYADRVLQAANAPKLAELEKQIDSDLKPRSRVLKGVELSAKITIDRPGIETKNVIGVLEGSGPHADETVIVGGHYDHLGRGGLFSGSLAFLSNDIHNGADDNASGTAMMMEMARRLASRRDPLPRRVVFMAFSGEERGLLGSQYYVNHPLYPLSSTVMMVNFDMVGRLNGKNELTMIGTGTTPGVDALVEALGKTEGLTIKQVKGMTDGFGGSDHQSFYGKDIPVLFAFTGLHSDYHRPSDDSDRINYTGMSRIADYLELIVLDLVRRPERPAFTKLISPSRGGRSASAGMSVTLGVMPDYGDEAKNGMKLSDVRPGGPAAKAGIKGGDSIIRIGGKPVATIYDYMESLRGYKPGDKLDVVVRRDGKEIKLQVDLSGSSPRPRN
ncbi:MAG: M28 family peptidase [Isosphaeraceae bacterium]